MNRLWRPLPLVGVSLTLAGVMLWPQIVRHLPNLSSRSEYQLSWSDLHVTPPGQWVPEDLLEQVRVQSELPRELSLLDDSLVGRLASAFARHPWVESVESVAKQSEGVRVDLTYRRPTVMVQTSRGMYPVDAHGVLLPPLDFTAADVEEFPRVDGVRSMPQGPIGTPWGDRAVSGAALLADRLTRGDDHETPWERYGLQAIVVRSQQGPVASVADIIFGLITTGGSQIVWGHAPGADSLEPTVDQKLERLDTFLANNGRFEYLDQPVYIDITDWKVIRWELLSKVPGQRVFR